MNNKLKFTTCTYFLALLCFGVNAQMPKGTTIKSPNVHTFQLYGKQNINYYTGKPDISVPVYTIRGNADVAIPIALQYQPDAVKPNEHPGWVGLGWNLSGGGMITRNRNDNEDEYTWINDGYIPYFPENPGDMSGAEKLYSGDWSSEDFLLSLHYEESNYYDVYADEFTFTFLGYSGKFYYTPDGWVVDSDSPIKVELGTGGKKFLSQYEISSAMQDNLQLYSATENSEYHPDDKQSRMFNGFTLTTEDGTKYEFGGNNAVEYSANYYDLSSYYSINTWHLKKITDVNGNEIYFEYDQKYPVCKFHSSLVSSFSECEKPGFLSWLLGPLIPFSTSSTDFHNSGLLMWPLYLKEINAGNTKVVYESSEFTQENYPDFFFTKRSSNSPINMSDYSRIGYTKDNIKMRKLDEIIVNYKGSEVSRYQFDYDVSEDQKLELISVEEIDENNIKGKEFSFQYDDFDDLGGYGGNYIDHWGYYNGRNINDYTSVYDAKEPDESYLVTGLLTRITYPTGGYSTFEWEAHEYSKQISISDGRDKLESVSETIAGGARIKKITNYTSPTDFVEREFYYVKNYSNDVNIATLNSSGILNDAPTYTYADNNRSCDLGDGCTISFGFLYSTSRSGFKGRHVGYSEVVEKRNDGAYTIYHFSSLESGLDGKHHWDDPPEATVGWKEGEDVYMPYASRERERGEILGKYHFNKENVPVEKTEYSYRSDVDRENEFIRYAEFNNLLRCDLTNSIIFMSTFKKYTFSNYLTSKTEYKYDQNGNNPLVVSTTYNYNDKDLISKKTIDDSDKEIETYHFYPSDFVIPSQPIENYCDGLFSLIQKNAINIPIETIKLVDNKIVDGSLRLYKNQDDNVFLHKLLKINTSSPIDQTVANFKSGIGQSGGSFFYYEDTYYDTETVYDSYDAQGNILQYHKKDDVNTSFYWGYDDQYPVVKAVNATKQELYDATSGIYGALGIHLVTEPSKNATQEGKLRSFCNYVQDELPDAEVTIYTYKPLVGMTSQTGPDGITTYYEYDDFGRLEVVKDHEGNVLKKHEYNYGD